MVEVEIRRPVYDEETGKAGWNVLTIVRANDGRVDLFGDEDVIKRTMPVVDITTGRSIQATDNAEAWARNLTHAFRAGDVVAVTVFDTDPQQTANTGRDAMPEPPTIPAPPAPAGDRDSTLVG